VGVGDVDTSSRYELVVLELAEDLWVSVDKCPKVGRGHDGGWSSEARVFILVGCCSKSTSNSGVWRSSELTHES